MFIKDMKYVAMYTKNYPGFKEPIYIIYRLNKNNCIEYISTYVEVEYDEMNYKLYYGDINKRSDVRLCITYDNTSNIYHHYLMYGIKHDIGIRLNVVDDSTNLSMLKYSDI